MAGTVVLVYSGGLDTSVCIPMMREDYGFDRIVTVTVDVGQPADDIRQRRRARAGARAPSITPSTPKREFVSDYCWPAVKANGDYQGYPLSTAIARPLIALKAVEAAKKHRRGRILPRLHRARERSVPHRVRHAGSDARRARSSRRCGSTTTRAPRRSNTPRRKGVPIARHGGQDLEHRREPLGPLHRRRAAGGAGLSRRRRRSSNGRRGIDTANRRARRRWRSASRAACPCRLDGRALDRCRVGRHGSNDDRRRERRRARRHHGRPHARPEGARELRVPGGDRASQGARRRSNPSSQRRGAGLQGARRSEMGRAGVRGSLVRSA